MSIVELYARAERRYWGLLRARRKEEGGDN